MAIELQAQSRVVASAKERLFDPEEVARLEVAGWRAYYDRKWPKMLWLVLSMVHDQFGYSWLRAMQASYYIVTASAAWVPLDHDLRKVLRYLYRYYRIAAIYGKHYHFDPKEVARRELVYWHYNRKVASQPYTGQSPLIPALAELHAATFGISVQDAWGSAVGRARSLHTVGKITGRTSTDVEADWRLTEQYLREGYESLVAHLP